MQTGHRKPHNCLHKPGYEKPLSSGEGKCLNELCRPGQQKGRTQEWLLNTQHGDRGRKRDRCELPGAQGGQSVGPTAPPQDRRYHHPGSEGTAIIPSSPLFTVLSPSVGRKWPVLRFSPLFKRSNSSQHMCLHLPFTRHRLQDSAPFPP